MTWIAVRTKPGAQTPKREYTTEATSSRKGYRLVPSLDPHMSAVERALSDAGFTVYMAAEYDVVRNRHKKGLYELRRFALLKGYVFVADIEDHQWPKLMKVPGVQGVVANNWKPVTMKPMDMFRLRMFEANSKALALAKAEAMKQGDEEQMLRRAAGKNARRALKAKRAVKIKRGNKARDIQRLLDASVETLTVPHEQLKAAS